MGGLASKLPITHLTMLVATLAIAGIPPFAGFFSKDEILRQAFASGHYGVWLAGLLGAVLTAFYMFRLYFLTFRGEFRGSPSPATHAHDADASGDAHAAGDDHAQAHGIQSLSQVHESPWVMTLPLVLLGVLSVIGGWVGLPMQPGGNVFERWLAPVLESGAHAAGAHAVASTIEIGLMVLSVVVAVVGIWFAFRAYLGQPALSASLRERFAGLHRALFNKYWVDEFYESIAVSPVYRGSVALWRFWDEKVVDGAVNGVASMLEGTSAILRLFQTGFVGTYALFLALGVVALFLHFLRP